MSRYRSSLTVLLPLLTVIAALVVLPSPARAGSYALDPTANRPLPSGATGWSCTHRPMGSTCEDIMIRALNRGRAAMGEPAYHLPSRFRALAGAEQLLVLSNLDRKLYGRLPISGFNADLNTSARSGAMNGGDPEFVPVGGAWPSAGGSNWAGGTRSPLVSYFLWMFVDGPYWEHRHNTLLKAGSSSKLAMGAAHGTDADGRPAWTELYEAFPSTAPVPLLPTVITLFRHSGSTAGGDRVAVAGFGFRRVTGVAFGTVPAEFTVDSLNVIHAIAPRHASGLVHVRVTTAAGTSLATRAAAYRYG